MRHSIKYILILINVVQMHAQGITKQALWQQKTNYVIHVTLNPETRTLNADISIHYFNNSPDTLKSIWLHVWPNAYKNNQTAFALQQLKDGKTDFQFCNENEKGHIEGFRFMNGEDSLQWHFDKKYIDILEVKLNKPLLPHTDLTITTPFRVKLPKIFSRGGFKGSFYAITQWYPKPAVYDVNGWNTMPYLDQGEFYSEFGDFKVSITLPEKYLVAATGNLQTPSEIKLMDSVVRNGGHYANHSNRLRTMTFEEKNIHDFAWFADSVFIVEKSFARLHNGDTVNTWIFMNKADKYVSFTGIPLKPSNKAIKDYSERVGNYPYKNCTVVIGNLIAGGGMEYPTITVCNTPDKTTIIHEVGHNWFYGMLGTNERTYPWMDESINTYYEQKINGDLIKYDSGFFGKLKNMDWLNNYDNLAGYIYTARLGISQPLNLPSDDFSNLNYGAIVYAKGPLLFAYLEQQLGDTLFQKCMQQYFSEWQFRHPLPGDMQASFEKTSGQSLDWFFNDLLNENNTIDVVKRRDGYKVTGSAKLDSLVRKNKMVNPNPCAYLPERNYLNNGQKLKLISVSIPLHLPRQNSRIAINLTPLAGYNYYDKLYVGAAIYNRTLFRKKFEYLLIPAYAIGTKKMVGYGQMNGLFFSKRKTLFKTEAGVQGQSFGLSYFSHLNQYYRINPYIRFHFKHKGKINEAFEKLLLINFYHTGLQNTSYVGGQDSNKNDLTYNFPATYFFNYYKVTYSFEKKHPVHNINFRINTEYGYNYKFAPQSNQYIKTWLNAGYKFTYDKKKKYFRTELFAGVFINKQGNIGNKEFYLSGNNGAKDYLYNESMIGRSENAYSNNILGRQIINTNGNMRNISRDLAADKWLVSLCNDISLPGIVPLRIYADFGYYRYITYGVVNTVNRPEIYTTAGIILPLFKETLEIFVPVYQSKQFKTSLSNSIGFKLNLNKLHPFKLIDNFRP